MLLQKIYHTSSLAPGIIVHIFVIFQALNGKTCTMVGWAPTLTTHKMLENSQKESYMRSLRCL